MAKFDLLYANLYIHLSELKFCIMSSEVVFAFLIIIISSNLIEPSYSQTTSEVILEAGVLGQIQGKISTTIGKSPRPYAQFFGIPYAKQTRFRVHTIIHIKLKLSYSHLIWNYKS